MQMDEEDLYSAVGRQSHAAEPDEQEDATEEDDALNADTFGESALGSAVANNGAAPARPAWTSAGATVALLSASTRLVSAGLTFDDVGCSLLREIVTMHVDNSLGLSLVPYSRGEHWLSALQAFNQCSLAAACHLAVVTCSKQNAQLQEQSFLLSH